MSVSGTSQRKTHVATFLVRRETLASEGFTLHGLPSRGSLQDGFTYLTPLRGCTHTTDRGPRASSAVLTTLITLFVELRNIYPISIGYASRPHLRSRLTLPGRAVCRNPWAYGDEDSHFIYRYSYQQQLLSYLQRCSRSAFSGLDNAPLPRKMPAGTSHSQLRFYASAPLRFRRNVPRPVSYYAFFKG